MKCYKIWNFMVAFFLLLAILPVMPAQAAKTSPVRVGYYDYTGVLERETNGGYKGYVYDYLQEIAYYTGWEYEYVYGSWQECLRRLNNGEIDLLCTLQKNEDRANLFAFGKYEAGLEYAVLLVEEDNHAVFYDDYDSFDGLRIGFMQGNQQNAIFEQLAQEKGFSYTSSYFSSAKMQSRALEDGRVDAILTSSLQRGKGKKAVARFSPLPFFFAAPKGREAFIDQLNKAMEALQTEDVNYNTKLYSKYYGDSAVNNLAFTREETEFIAAHPTLRVAYDEDWNPISYTDATTKQFEGISQGVLNLISERSGISFTYIATQSEYDALNLIKNGEADLLYGFPEQYSQEARRYGVALTKPYFNVPVHLNVMGEYTPGSIQKIAVPSNTNSLFRFAKELFPHAEVVSIPRTDDCIQALEWGEVDAVFENSYVLDQYGKNRRDVELNAVESSRAEMPLSLGVSAQEDAVLRTLLNKIISQIDMTEISNMVVENTMAGPRAHLSLLLKQYAPPVLALFFLLVLIIMIHSQRKIARFAFIDTITGHGNTAKFMLSADKLFRSKGYFGYAVVSIDIDKFKLINNMHSYETGNKILRAISQVFDQALTGNEIFCRDSNDQFILLMRDVEGERLEQRLPELMSQVTALPRVVGESFLYTVSCGVYIFQEKDADIHQAVGWAGLARERAKGHHQDWIVYYSDVMREEAEREQMIENQMEAALVNEEFEVYFQPKIRLSDDTLVGAEALVRWKPKDGTLRYPDQFIPVFEGNGFIVPLDLYVFQRVCIQLRKWLDRGISPCRVSVNLSRVHLGQADFYLNYFELLHRYNVPHNLIEIEITESTIFEDSTQIASLISKLKTNGLAVSIDDFGSGYSSLSVMKDLPFDYLKLDKEFFNTAADTERGKKVIQGAIYLADRLNMAVVAEGVETQEQIDFLREIHCDIVQGYYFSRPLPVGDFEKFAQWDTVNKVGAVG